MTLLNDILKAPHEISLKNKTALITGASAGIGLATAALLAREGVHLILVARRQEKLDALKSEIKTHFPNVKVTTHVLDLRQKNSIAELQKNHACDVDILINNAGLALGRSAVPDLLPEDIEEMIETNITAAIKLASVVSQNMCAKGSGHIVNLGSIAGHYTYEGGAVYCATKFAIRAFTEALRQEMHTKNVRVSLISPGMVSTDFSLVRFKGDTEKASAVYANTSALQATDIARTIVKTLKEPQHVNYDEVIVLPTMQAPVSYKVARH